MWVIDGVCSVLPKTDCVELCEHITEKNNLKKSVLKNSDVNNLTIKATAKFESSV